MGYRKNTPFPLILQLTTAAIRKHIIVDPKQLGERMRRAREARGISQERFAELIERDQRSVSEYENGKRRIYANDLPRIANALEVSLIELFEDVLEPIDSETMLLTEYRKLNGDGQKTLLQIARLFTQVFASK